MKDNREAGFTLVETLITLLITSLLIFMPVLAIDQMIKSIQVDMFFRELSSNITLIQNHSILTGERTIIEFIPQGNVIRFKEYDTNNSSKLSLNRELHLQEGLYELDGKNYQNIIFHGETGHIAVSNQKWRTKFTTSQGSYELVFQLGSGRFDIRKK